MEACLPIRLLTWVVLSPVLVIVVLNAVRGCCLLVTPPPEPRVAVATDALLSALVSLDISAVKADILASFSVKRALTFSSDKADSRLWGVG